MLHTKNLRFTAIRVLVESYKPRRTSDRPTSYISRHSSIIFIKKQKSYGFRINSELFKAPFDDLLHSRQKMTTGLKSKGIEIDSNVRLAYNTIGYCIGMDPPFQLETEVT